MLTRSWMTCGLLLIWPMFLQAWPKFDRPDFIKTDWVAGNIVRNGMPMHIENITCDCSYEKILDFYRTLWADIDEKGFVETDLGDLQQISRGDEKYFYSVQIKADPGDAQRSVGRLVITEMPGPDGQKVVLGEGIPMLNDSTVMTDIVDTMPGKVSRTVLLVNSKGIVENMTFYRSHYQTLGWKSFLFPVNPNMGSQALSYQNGKDDVNITITDESGSSVVLVNHVKATF